MPEQVQLTGINTPEEAFRLLLDLADRAKEKNRAESEKKEIEEIAKRVMKMITEAQKGDPEIEKKSPVEVIEEAKPEIQADPKGVAKSINLLIETPTNDPDILQLQELNDDIYLASQITKRPPNSFREYQEFFAGKSPLSKRVSKAINQDVTGAGAEWVPTGFSAQFIERVESERRLLKIHKEITIPKGVKTLDVGAAGAAINMFYYPDTAQDEAAKIPKQTANTRSVSFTPKTLACRVLIPESYEEDCALPIAQIYKDELVKAYARAIDKLFISGDTSSSPMDYNNTSSLDVRKMFDGYRRYARTVSNRAAISGASLAISDIRARIKQMGVYGSPTQCVLVTSYAGFWAIQETSDVLLWNQYNAKPLFPGEMGLIPSLGLRIVVSDQYPTNLDASGNGTASGTLTSLIVVNQRAFIIGKKRELYFEETKDPETARKILVARARLSFEAAYANTEKFVGEIYNFS